jgi:hypothetical protein
MGTTPDDKNDILSTTTDAVRRANTLAIGAGIGILGRMITWGPEWVVYQSSQKNCQQTLPELYRSLLRTKTFGSLQKSFLQAGLVQTVGKSTANSGVLHYVNTYYDHLPPLQMGSLHECTL